MLYLDGVVIAFSILMLVVIWLGDDEDRRDKIVWVLFIVGGLVGGLAGLHLLRIFPLY
jgi:hypothetical protein